MRFESKEGHTVHQMLPVVRGYRLQKETLIAGWVDATPVLSWDKALSMFAQVDGSGLPYRIIEQMSDGSIGVIDWSEVERDIDA